MVSNLEPQEIDFDLEWAELRNSLGGLSNWYSLSNGFTHLIGQMYKFETLFRSSF